ncbi:MAG: DUF1508 domain-containing protein [Eubacteriales bacterium]
MAAGRYEISKNSEGKYFFRLLTVSGKPLLHSGIYENLAVCRKGVASLRVNADAPLEDKTGKTESGAEQKDGSETVLKCPKIELYEEKNAAGYGSYNFVVRARNGAAVARGEGYGTKKRALEAVENFRYTAFSAETQIRK